MMTTLDVSMQLDNIHFLTTLSIQSNINNTISSTYLLEDSFEPFQFTLKNVFLVLFLFCLGVVTIFGNIIVILAIFVDFRLRQPTHYLMGSLALADLLLGK